MEDSVNREQAAELERIRRNLALRGAARYDDDGRWVTTEEDHKLHINEKGEIDKGNPHVIKAIHGFKAKKTKSEVPVGARLKKGDEYFVKQSNGDFINPDTGEVLDDKDISSCTRDRDTAVKDQFGKPIDIGHCPLEYGGKTSVSQAVRNGMSAFESKRKKAKIEYGCLLDTNGNPVGKVEYKGGHGSVKYPIQYAMKAESLTHIHPRGEGKGELGGTFSLADFKIPLVCSGMKTIRAAASEGIYSFQYTDKTNRQGFYNWIRDEYNKIEKEYKKSIGPAEDKVRQAGKDYKSGKITYEEYGKVYKDYAEVATYHFNALLVANHNTLLSGQEQFGYHYTLERWD